MPRINIKIQPNEFYTTNTQSVLLDILSRHNISNADYGYIFLGYPNWHQSDIDLFQYLEKDFINSLCNNKTCLVVDYTYEGFSRIECPIIKILEDNCVKYNINPKKIFYFSGNLRDASDLINVIPIFLLDHDSNFKNLVLDIEKIKKDCADNLNDKIILSLSRRNRYYRVLAHAMLFNSSLRDYALISQDTLENFRINDNILANIGYNKKLWKRFNKSLPLIADKNQFHINEPFNYLPELHQSTCFSIVNETLINDCNQTSLFFSEKILKPIINLQPMIIYGQPGINYGLKKLGYEPYDDYFDLSFDNEKDDILRYKKLLNSITPVVENLSNSDVNTKIEWRFKNLDKLRHNFNNFIKQTHSNLAANEFSKIISKL